MSKRILVVEGDSGLARVLRDNFAFDGFEVLSTGDAAAIERVRTFQPHLVVIDGEAPDRNLEALADSLRDASSAPVLALSVRAAPTLDGAELLSKPFDLDDLLERVRVLMELSSTA
jgi:two-component system KDP operon response regulator KdpE